MKHVTVRPIPALVFSAHQAAPTLAATAARRTADRLGIDLPPRTPVPASRFLAVHGLELPAPTALPQRLARAFWNKVLQKNVPLPGNITTPLYINLRLIFADAPLRKLVFDAFTHALAPLSYDYLVGPPLTGTAIVAALADRLDKASLLLRNEPKGYGGNALLEGVWKPNQVVVLVDDILSSGDSLLKAVDNVRAQGLSVSDVVILTDKGEGGRERLEARGVRVHTAVQLPALLAALVKDGVMTVEENATIDALFALHWRQRMHRLFLPHRGELQQRAQKFPVTNLCGDYVFEKLDPQHRVGLDLLGEHETFKKLEERHAGEHPVWRYTGGFWQWLDDEGRGKDIPPVTQLTSAAARKPWHAVFENNGLRVPELTGPVELMWVMDADGNFFVHPKERGGPGKPAFHHSSFFAGEPVASAGLMKIDADGTLIELKDWSGHYRPREAELANALVALGEQGVDLGCLSLNSFHGGQGLAQDWLDNWLARQVPNASDATPSPWDLTQAKYPSSLLQQVGVRPPQGSGLAQLVDAQQPLGVVRALAMTEREFEDTIRWAFAWLNSPSSIMMYAAPERQPARWTTLPFLLGESVRRPMLNLAREILQARSCDLQRQDAPIHADVACIGAGAHGTSVAARLAETHPELRCVLLEATDAVSANFGRSGAGFALNNTLDRPDGGPDYQAGGKYNTPYVHGPVQVTDLTGERWPSAEVLADTITANLAASGADVLFDAKVSGVHETHDAALPRYALRFATGRTVYANHVVISTGLGTPVNPLSPEAPGHATIAAALEAIERQDPGVLADPTILTVEQAFRLANPDDPMHMWRRPQDSTTDSTTDSTEDGTLVVGLGNSGVTFLEFLAHVGPASATRAERVQFGEMAKITCLTGLTGPANADAYEAKARHRYKRVASAMDGLINLEAKRLLDVSLRPDGKPGCRCALQDQAGAITYQNVRRLVLATGYERRWQDIVRDFIPAGCDIEADENSLVFDYPANASTRVPVAKQLPGQAITVVGPAAGRNMVSAYAVTRVTQPGQEEALSQTTHLTVKAADLLAAGLVPLPQPCAAVAPVLEGTRSGQTATVALPPSGPDRGLLVEHRVAFELRALLALALAPCRVTGISHVDITLGLTSSGLALAGNLAAASLQAVGEAWLRYPSFVGLLKRQLGDAPHVRLRGVVVGPMNAPRQIDPTSLELA